jgi:hypothetical protein
MRATMFYDLGLRVAFIHIPRSSGVAVTLAFKPIIGLGGGIDLGVMRHKRRLGMEALLAGEDVRFFAVYREFTEIVASWRRLIMRDRDLLERGAAEGFSEQWKSILRAPDPVAESWRRAGWPDTEYDWWRFWLDGRHGHATRILRFHCLADDLRSLCREWNLPMVALPSERVN